MKQTEHIVPPSIGRLLRIRGQVQGVGFRWYIEQMAAKLVIAGWVRNRHDGSVEALIYGAPEAVAQMIHWASQGPAQARVDEVLVEETPEQATGFTRAATC